MTVVFILDKLGQKLASLAGHLVVNGEASEVKVTLLQTVG